MYYETSVDVAATAEKVWSVLVDVERWPDWTRSVISAKRLDGGAFAEGSQVLIKQPKLAPLVWTVTELEELHSFTWLARSLGLTTVAQHRLDATSQGATVTLSIQMTGPLAGLVALMAGRLTREYVEIEAAGLKHESETRSTYGTL